MEELSNISCHSLLKLIIMNNNIGCNNNTKYLTNIYYEKCKDSFQEEEMNLSLVKRIHRSDPLE